MSLMVLYEIMATLGISVFVDCFVFINLFD